MNSAHSCSHFAFHAVFFVRALASNTFLGIRSNPSGHSHVVNTLTRCVCLFTVRHPIWWNYQMFPFRVRECVNWINRLLASLLCLFGHPNKLLTKAMNMPFRDIFVQFPKPTHERQTTTWSCAMSFFCSFTHRASSPHLLLTIRSTRMDLASWNNLTSETLTLSTSPALSSFLTAKNVNK